MRSIPAKPLDAVVRVSIADPELERAVAEGIAQVLRVPVRTSAPTVRVRTRKRLAAIDPTGKFVILSVTAANARHLPAMVDAVRPTSLGVQLVWDGRDPPRERAERHVFAVLEHARATPGASPVILSSTDELELALPILAKEKGQR